MSDTAEKWLLSELRLWPQEFCILIDAGILPDDVFSHLYVLQALPKSFSIIFLDAQRCRLRSRSEPRQLQVKMIMAEFLNSIAYRKIFWLEHMFNLGYIKNCFSILRFSRFVLDHRSLNLISHKFLLYVCKNRRGDLRPCIIRIEVRRCKIYREILRILIGEPKKASMWNFDSIETAQMLPFQIWRWKKTCRTFQVLVGSSFSSIYKNGGLNNGRTERATVEGLSQLLGVIISVSGMNARLTTGNQRAHELFAAAAMISLFVATASLLTAHEPIPAADLLGPLDLKGVKRHSLR